MAPALEQRLATQFGPDPRFDSARAPQVRLTPFDFDRLVEVGRKVLALYPARNAARIGKVDDAMLRALAENVRGALGGKLGIAPRVYLRKLVQLLDTLDEHADFDPVEHGGLVVSADEAALELSSQAREDAVPSRPAVAAMTAADVSLDLDGSWDARGDGSEGADE
jgi:hypothetical protein